jgi:hypothetical protein
MALRSGFRNPVLGLKQLKLLNSPLLTNQHRIAVLVSSLVRLVDLVLPVEICLAFCRQYNLELNY